MKECPARHWRAVARLIRSASLLRFAEPLGQTTGSGLPNQRLPAPGWSVEQKPLRLRKLEPFERLRMHQRIFNRLANRSDGLVLSSDLFPRDRGCFIQNMATGLPIHQFLKGYTETGIDSNVVPRTELDTEQIRRTLQNQRLPAHILFKPQPAVR